VVPGVVDVWRVDLSRASEDGLAELLCARERARAARIVDARRRALWVRSRGVLRALLARCLDADPRALRFEYGEHGKPALGERAVYANGPGAEPDLRFNLSHSGERLLVALTAGREVGVDVERARGRHTAEFLRAWTAREARVKCLGAGLGAAPVVGEAPIVGEGAPEGMWTTELDVGPWAFAALAAAGREECELHRRDWPG
jgi:4'-phosphopantetheinyl transferase